MKISVSLQKILRQAEYVIEKMDATLESLGQITEGRGEVARQLFVQVPSTSFKHVNFFFFFFCKMRSEEAIKLYLYFHIQSACRVLPHLNRITGCYNTDHIPCAILEGI